LTIEDRSIAESENNEAVQNPVKKMIGCEAMNDFSQYEKTISQGFKTI